MLHMINKDPIFLSRALFSDEANFYNDGQINSTCITGLWRILIGHELFLFNFWSLNVWQSCYRITFFWRIFKWQSTDFFLENIFPQLLENIQLGLRINMIQHEH